ncbi:MAG: class I SAM-dependent methyltransferase [Saprospiraceae bacterium]
MLDFLSTIYHYCEENSKDMDPLLTDLERATHLQTTNPRMLSGTLQGLFLQMISTLINPSQVLEIGTFTGYSAICLAKGLKKDGQLITIDNNPETLTLAHSYFIKAGLSEKISIRQGNALDIIPTINRKYDLVFIDADKENYANYYHLVKPMMNQGGYILLDNMLWSGKVLEESQDAKTKILHELNQYICQDKDVENILIPLRDGINMVRIL